MNESNLAVVRQVVDALRERDIPRLRKVLAAEGYLDPEETLARVQ